jgi:nitrite reductase/ring-hydroxylating ferredoxin subunit
MKRVEVASAADVREGEILVKDVDGVSILLTRVEGTVYAVANKCPHLGWSMARGSVEGKVLRCPWHGSEFDVCSGENLDWVNSVAGIKMPGWSRRLIGLGSTPAPVETFEASEESGSVFVSLPA